MQSSSDHRESAFMTDSFFFATVMKTQAETMALLLNTITIFYNSLWDGCLTATLKKNTGDHMIVDEAINYVEQHSVSIYIRNVTTDVECGDVFIQIETSMLNVNEDGCFDQDMILELLVDELEVEGDDDELNDFGLAALECFNVRNAIE